MDFVVYKDNKKNSSSQIHKAINMKESLFQYEFTNFIFWKLEKERNGYYLPLIKEWKVRTLDLRTSILIYNQTGIRQFSKKSPRWCSQIYEKFIFLRTIWIN